VWEVLLLLTPIALLDSLSMLPFGIVVLAVLLSGDRPYASSLSFLAGTAGSYFAAGLLIALGLGDLIGRASAAVSHRFWHPETIDYILGLAIGLALVFFGYRLAVMRQEKGKKKDVSAGMTPAQALFLGAGATIAGIWGALPYFAAIDQLLKAEASPAESALGLAYYNLVFISILLLLVGIRAVLGTGANALFERLNAGVAVWGKRALVVAMVALGLLMVADSIGYLAGHPLIPTKNAVDISDTTVETALASR
jgi:hypothetical protein